MKDEVSLLIRGAFHRQVSPALQRGPKPISNGGYVMGFRLDSALDVSSTVVAALRFWRPLTGYGLDSRPRAIPNRVKWGSRASLSPTPLSDFCNVYDKDARARSSSVRFSPALSARLF